MNLYIVTNGDLYDYDAPAPGAIFLTEREAWKFISDSGYFMEYGNGSVHYFTDYSYIYEVPIGVELTGLRGNVRETLMVSYWVDLAKENKGWRP